MTRDPLDVAYDEFMKSLGYMKVTKLPTYNIRDINFDKIRDLQEGRARILQRIALHERIRTEEKKDP